MHDIIEHYGKVVIALAGVLAAVLLTAAVVTIVSDRTKGAVSDISYKEHIYDAIDASRPISNVRNVYGERTASGADRE